MQGFARSATQPLKPRLGWIWSAALALAWVFDRTVGKGNGTGPARSPLALVARGLTQDQGAWIVDYRLRNTGRTGVIVTPEDLG